MRFSKLRLEKYGHFENHDLSFRAGFPDLHVIHGSNEAGKTTALNAVSDLLFGFPARSPYNFMFDYPLLRVGGVLEDDGVTFECRRKKGTTATLMDAEDQPLEEGRLLAMLRGQDRDTFNSSFSLTQEGLRAGGQAMLDAKDDVGKALFAAGSGLTSVSEELARLEAEVDAIWAPRKSAKRSFTQTERDYIDSSKLVRENSLKPKAWIDAKTASSNAKSALETIERKRDDLLIQVAAAERVRRLAPSIQLRAQLRRSLEELGKSAEISSTEIESTQQAMSEMADASHDKSIADNLVKETKRRMDAIDFERAILNHADEIDALRDDAGLMVKASSDFAKNKSNLAFIDTQIELRQKAIGNDKIAPPTAIISARLRKMSEGHELDTSLFRQSEEDKERLNAKRGRLLAATSKSEHLETLPKLVLAVDAAQQLGDEVDERCVEAARRARSAEGDLTRSLARLTPWVGDYEQLSVLPNVSEEEIEQVRRDLDEARSDAAKARQNASRARDEIASLEQQIATLSAGPAVTTELLMSARSNRDEQWEPIKRNILSSEPVPISPGVVADYESGIRYSDETSDQRYLAAEESSLLIQLTQRKEAKQLEAEQGDASALAANNETNRILDNWTGRLINTGFPSLDPLQFKAWLNDKNAALAAGHALSQAKADAASSVSRRDKARSNLVASLPEQDPSKTGEELAPLLAIGITTRRTLEADAEKQRLDANALRDLDEDLADRIRTSAKFEVALEENEARWSEALETLGLDIDIGNGSETLDILDALQGEIASRKECSGIILELESTLQEHGERVDVLAEALNETKLKSPADTLAHIAAKLKTAQLAENSRNILQSTLDQHQDAADMATAKLKAAHLVIDPLLESTKSVGVADLSVVLENAHSRRNLTDELASTEEDIITQGDGFALGQLIAEIAASDIENIVARLQRLGTELKVLNEEVATLASEHGDAKRAFADLDSYGGAALKAASEVEQARAELNVLAEDYILKQTQIVTLRWAIERYREQNQDPLLRRASEIFSTLTLGRYASLTIETDGSTHRLFGLRDDGRTVVDVGGMSEGTIDQLFLALRLAALEQSVAAGTRLPFLADDLFVNFDDQRSEAGFKVLAELASKTQVLFFTHHPHLADIAKDVVGDEMHSQSELR